MKETKILCALLVVFSLLFLTEAYLLFSSTRELKDRLKTMEETLEAIYNPCADDEPFITVIR